MEIKKRALFVFVIGAAFAFPFFGFCQTAFVSPDPVGAAVGAAAAVAAPGSIGRSGDGAPTALLDGVGSSVSPSRPDGSARQLSEPGRPSNELPKAALPRDSARSAALQQPSQAALPRANARPGAPASSAPADADVRGKTLLLVGARSSRPFILEETARVARELGLKLLLLDRPENRAHSAALVPDSDFIPAPIDQRDDSTMKKIVEQVAGLAKQRKIDVVAAFRSHHAKLVGRIVDELHAAGVPKKAVVTADDKAKTREALSVVAELAVPSRKVESAAEARQAFRELRGGKPMKFVMKSNHGENSRFITMGIDSEDAAERAFRKMDAELRDYAKKSEAGSTIFNRYPGILMEQMLELAPGTHESSVEMVMRDGKPVFAMVSDTHGIGPREEYAGGSLTFPSQQSAAIQQAFVGAAAKALAVIGIKDGNARVDMMMTPEGARVIEVNPYMGGAAIWKCVKLLTGVSLVEYGVRALLGLSLPPVPNPSGVVDYRFVASQFAGRIESIDGLDKAGTFPGVEHLQMLAAAGDSVSAPDGNSFEEIAEIMGVGANLDEARSRGVSALREIKIRVRPESPLLEETGDYLQPSDPPSGSEITKFLEQARRERSPYAINRAIESYYERMKARLTFEQLVRLLAGLSRGAGGAYDPTHAYSRCAASERIAGSYFELNPPGLTASKAVELAAVYKLPALGNYRIVEYYEKNKRALSWADAAALLAGLSPSQDFNGRDEADPNSQENAFHRIMDSHLGLKPQGLAANQFLKLLKKARSPWSRNYLIENYFQNNKQKLSWKDVRALLLELGHNNDARYNAKDAGDRILLAWEQAAQGDGRHAWLKRLSQALNRKAP